MINLNLSNRKSIATQKPELVIQLAASMTSWWAVHERIMVVQGEISLYKHIRIKDSKICNTDFLQGENN